jgi:hypothetical protein
MKICSSAANGPLITTPYQNNVLDFYSTDTEHRYLKNSSDFKFNGVEWLYADKVINYKFNSQGYRTAEWIDISWTDAVVVFGCSCVVGEGLAEDDTITSQLSKRLNRPVINLGVSGTGMLFSFYNSTMLCKNLPTPYAVVQLWSDCNRMEIYTEDTIRLHLPSRVGKHNTYDGNLHDAFFQSWVTFPENPNTHAWFMSHASRLLWDTRTKYYELTMFAQTAQVLGCPLLEAVDYGRDLGHSGIETAKLIAENIAEHIG